MTSLRGTCSHLLRGQTGPRGPGQTVTTSQGQGRARARVTVRARCSRKGLCLLLSRVEGPAHFSRTFPGAETSCSLCPGWQLLPWGLGAGWVGWRWERVPGSLACWKGARLKPGARQAAWEQRAEGGRTPPADTGCLLLPRRRRSQPACHAISRGGCLFSVTERKRGAACGERRQPWAPLQRELARRRPAPEVTSCSHCLPRPARLRPYVRDPGLGWPSSCASQRGCQGLPRRTPPSPPSSSGSSMICSEPCCGLRLTLSTLLALLTARLQSPALQSLPGIPGLPWLGVWDLLLGPPFLSLPLVSSESAPFPL